MPIPSACCPVQEVFAHIRDMREFYAAVVRSRKIHEVQALGRGFFARSIEERLESAGVKLEPLERSAKAYALARSFFSLLDWWIDKGMKAEPKEMDAIFHRMAWNGLTEPRARPNASTRKSCKILSSFFVSLNRTIGRLGRHPQRGGLSKCRHPGEHS
jgi:tetracycline repressor-like protein